MSTTTPLEIPAVCFLEDVCRALRISRSTVERMRRHGTFPIRELPALDKRPRWSGEDVRKFIEREPELKRQPWRKRA